MTRSRCARPAGSFETTPLGGHVLGANENFLDLMKYRLEDIKGEHHPMFCEPDYARSPSYKQFWLKLGIGECDADEYKRLGRNRKEVWIQASYNPILDR